MEFSWKQRSKRKIMAEKMVPFDISGAGESDRVNDSYTYFLPYIFLVVIIWKKKPVSHQPAAGSLSE